MDFTRFRRQVAAALAGLCAQTLIDRTQARRDMNILVEAFEDLGAPAAAVEQLRQWVLAQTTAAAWERA